MTSELLLTQEKSIESSKSGQPPEKKWGTLQNGREKKNCAGKDRDQWNCQQKRIIKTVRHGQGRRGAEVNDSKCQTPFLSAGKKTPLRTNSTRGEGREKCDGRRHKIQMRNPAQKKKNECLVLPQATSRRKKTNAQDPKPSIGREGSRPPIRIIAWRLKGDHHNSTPYREDLQAAGKRKRLRSSAREGKYQLQKKALRPPITVAHHLEKYANPYAGTGRKSRSRGTWSLTMWNGNVASLAGRNTLGLILRRGDPRKESASCGNRGKSDVAGVSEWKKVAKPSWIDSEANCGGRLAKEQPF